MWSYHFMANRKGKSGSTGRFYFLGLQTYCGLWLQPWNQKALVPWKERYDKPSACLLRRFSHVRLFVTPWTVACQTLLSMGFSRHEYWNGLPCLPPGDLPNPGIKPVSLTSPTWAGGTLPLVPMRNLGSRLKSKAITLLT